MFWDSSENGNLIANLLKAILLPSAIAAIKCNAHTEGSDDVLKGNAGAD